MRPEFTGADWCAQSTLPRAVLADPWDCLIVATALALGIPMANKRTVIRRTGLVSTIGFGASTKDAEGP
jgi:hypothetical protein